METIVALVHFVLLIGILATLAGVLRLVIDIWMTRS